jgi:hypothetical protein
VRVIFGCSQAEAAVSSSGVVVLGVLVEDSTQVSFTGDEESVGALCAGCAYPPFGERVGPGALRRRPDCRRRAKTGRRTTDETGPAGVDPILLAIV